MTDFTTFFLVLICITIFYVYLENKASDVTYVNLDQIEYLVRNLPDKDEAALLLCLQGIIYQLCMGRYYIIYCFIII